MSSEAATVFLTFPPRSLSEGDRETVRQWLAATTGIGNAFASERRGDDPAFYRRIVVIETGRREPSFLVHCPDGTDVWLVTTLGSPDQVQMYPTLRAALHAIRPAQGVTADPEERKAPDWMGGAPMLRRPNVSAAPARTVAEMAATLRRPRDVDSAVGAPRRKLS